LNFISNDLVSYPTISRPLGAPKSVSGTLKKAWLVEAKISRANAVTEAKTRLFIFGSQLEEQQGNTLMPVIQTP
jgi:hypothetical protein